MKIHPDGYWIGLDSPHGVDPKLAKGLADFFLKEKAESVIDLGCGNGYYTRYLSAVGIDCTGVDGNPFTEDYDAKLYTANLAEVQDFGLYDWVLSLEVGEHIPQQYMKTFLHNIDKHNRNGVILSWSIPEFGGDGHVNSLSNEEVKELFDLLGYINDLKSESSLRKCCANYPEPCWWFSKTLMVFRR